MRGSSLSLSNVLKAKSGGGRADDKRRRKRPTPLRLGMSYPELIDSCRWSETQRREGRGGRERGTDEEFLEFRGQVMSASRDMQVADNEYEHGSASSW